MLKNGRARRPLAPRLTPSPQSASGLSPGRLVLLLRRVGGRFDSFVAALPLLGVPAFGRDPALDGCAGRAGEESLRLPCSLAVLALGAPPRRRRFRGRRDAPERSVLAPSAAGGESLSIIALGPRGGVFWKAAFSFAFGRSPDCLGRLFRLGLPGRAGAGGAVSDLAGALPPVRDRRRCGADFCPPSAAPFCLPCCFSRCFPSGFPRCFRAAGRDGRSCEKSTTFLNVGGFAARASRAASNSSSSSCNNLGPARRRASSFVASSIRSISSAVSTLPSGAAKTPVSFVSEWSLFA